MSLVPEALYYTSEHEWVRQEEDNIITIGITDYAQSSLGDIVYIELPTVGETVIIRDILGTIESVKSVSEIYAPVNGTVIAVNEALVEQAELINKKPYAEGWLVQIKLQATDDSNYKPLDNLLTTSKYQKYVSQLS